jgi:DNA-binding transcriptional MocR family regulator
MNSGDRPPTATRVKTTVNENAVTPSNPHLRPAWRKGNGGAESTVALLLCFMSQSSSVKIVAGLESWIATAPPGAQLPSTRALTVEYQASPVTVQAALRALVTRGLVESRPGVGTFVRSIRAAQPADYGWQTNALRAPHTAALGSSSTMRTASNEVIALHAGYPDRELLPERMVRGALTRAARNESILSRSPAPGLPDLQSWFATELGRFTPAGITPPAASDVTVLPGSQSGLSSVFRALVGPGRPLLMESPTYWGALTAAAQAGVTVIPVPSGPHGPTEEDVDRAFTDSGARAFYAQPNFANPTGAQWSKTRASSILGIARAHGAFVIEDDWAHDFAIDTDVTPLAAHDDNGHVVYLRSLTKSVAPALRVAAVIARGPARERIRHDRAAESMYVSGILQTAALDVVTQPGWHTHLRQLRHQLRDRRDLLVTSLHTHAPAAHVDLIPTGGLNLWVRLPDGTDIPDLVERSERAGLLVASGREWFPAEPTGPYIRLNYAGPSPASFEQAARILCDLT